MKFDKEVEVLLEKYSLNENVFDSIGTAIKGSLKNLGGQFLDVVKAELPIISGMVKGGIDEKKTRLTGIAGVAENFLEEKFDNSSDKKVIINGTPYNYETLSAPYKKLVRPKEEISYIINGEKVLIPKKPEQKPKETDAEFAKRVKKFEKIMGAANRQYNQDSQINKSLTKARSLIRNKDLTSLNLLSDPNLTSEIMKFLEEQSEISKTKNIGDGKNDKNKTPININYSKIKPEEIIKNLERIIGFYLKTKNPQYYKTKLKYLFAFVKDRQIIR